MSTERPGGDDVGEGPAEGNPHLSDLEQSFQGMLKDRFLDGLVRRFEKLFPDYASHVEDVLYGEILKLAEAAGPTPRNVRAVLTWRLRMRMLDVAKRPPLGDEAEVIDYDTPEHRAIRKEMFDAIKSLLDDWENGTMALVVRLTLEAVYYGEALEVDDIKEIVYEQLGHELTTPNVWKLRSRGLKRLAEEVAPLLGEYAPGWDFNAGDAGPDAIDDLSNGEEQE